MTYIKAALILIENDMSDKIEKAFPVIDYKKHEGCPEYIKWSALDDVWAKRVHGGQNLERLAYRGGLGLIEIVYNINKLEWGTKVCPKFALNLVKQIAFTEKDQQIAALQSQVDRYREALEEICEPTEPDYYLGIRCGIEDRDLQNDPYEAAEYGYDQGKEYCQFIAGQALKEKP